MALKDTFEKEKRELSSSKRPYETVAFLVLSLMVLQNLFFLVFQILDYFKTKSWGFGNVLTRMNNSVFIIRIVNEFSGKPFLQILLTILLLALYCFLVYYFVWNYCKKNNLAKWTWTLFVVYGPNVFLGTPIVFFVIYVFRAYFARFAKRFVEEFKSFDPNHEFAEEQAEKFDENDYDKYIKDEPYHDEDSEEQENQK